MVLAMAGDLQAMRIPFFGTSGTLILSDGEKPANTAGETKSGGNDSEKPRRKISQAELVKLQKRMIQHLEDMYKE